MKVDGVIRVV
jgi:hypothetical protein